MDIHDLYELCVQSPEHLAPMLRAIHGGEPRVLGEDFSGTAALCRAWAEASGARAIAVDQDSAVLARAAHERVTTVAADVRDAPRLRGLKADVVFAGNFSIGYLHTREELLAYLRLARERTADRGVFVCDTYGGTSAFTPGIVERAHPVPAALHPELPLGSRVLYAWEQREADPLTARVIDVLHFRLESPGPDGPEIVQEWPDAFVYDWRLWSVPELREAILEAGFARTAVYGTMPDAVDGDGAAYVEPMSGDDVGESFIVLVAGHTTPDAAMPPFD